MSNPGLETKPTARPIAQTLIQSLITGLLLAHEGMWLYALTEGFTKWRLIWLILASGALLTWLILQFPRRQVLRSSGRVHAQETSLRLAINWNDGHSGSFNRYGITQKQFVAWFTGAGSGISLGETHWTGEGAHFTKTTYIKFRDALLLDGIIRHREGHYTRGFELTEKGKATCREVIRRFTPRPHNRLPILPNVTRTLRKRE